MKLYFIYAILGVVFILISCYTLFLMVSKSFNSDLLIAFFFLFGLGIAHLLGLFALIKNKIQIWKNAHKYLLFHTLMSFTLIIFFSHDFKGFNIKILQFIPILFFWIYYLYISIRNFPIK